MNIKYEMDPVKGYMNCSYSIDAVKFMALRDAGWTMAHIGIEFGLSESDARTVHRKILPYIDDLRKAREEREKKYYADYRSKE